MTCTSASISNHYMARVVRILAVVVIGYIAVVVPCLTSHDLTVRSRRKPHAAWRLTALLAVLIVIFRTGIALPIMGPSIPFVLPSRPSVPSFRFRSVHC